MSDYVPGAFKSEHPKLQNVSGLISSDEKPCFYVPRYQRIFSWDKTHCMEFLEDMANGLERMIRVREPEESDAVTFFGAAIFSHAISHDAFPSTDITVGPPDPNTLYGIIDGQQRMTTLMLTATVLHDGIHRLSSKDDPDWLVRWSESTCQHLVRIFEINVTVNGKPLCYPRMIRQGEDQWAETDAARYISPLPSYIHCYSKIRRDIPVGESVHAKMPKGHDMHTAVGVIKQFIDRRCGENCEDESAVKPMLQRQAVVQALALKNFRPELITDHQFTPQQNKLTKALMLASYMLHGVYFVIIKTSSSDFAFDIFQSLNTRGQSLTPYETFHALIIRDEKKLGVTAVEDVQHIQDFLRKRKSRDSSTAKMLESFALLKFGDEIAHRLKRKYLSDRYKQTVDTDGKAVFVRHLRHVADWMQFESDRDLGKLPGGIAEIPFTKNPQHNAGNPAIGEALFAMAFIQKANHVISHGVLGRFYMEAFNSTTDAAREENFCTLLAAIKSCAAFFALMRAAGIPPNKVANCHRDKIMNNLNLTKGAPANLKKLQEDLVTILDEEVTVRLQDEGVGSGGMPTLLERWREATRRTNIYKGGTSVAKFLIMVATHDADSDGSGRLIRKEDLAPIVGANAWGDPIYKTVEHIIPQSAMTGDEEFPVHQLGNLTLLPQKVNSILSDRAWPERKAIYAAFSARDDGEKEEARVGLASFTTPDGTRRFDDDTIDKFVNNGRPNLRMTRALSFLPDFGMPQLQARHNNLAQLAWQTLATEWLGYTK